MPLAMGIQEQGEALVGIPRRNVAIFDLDGTITRRDTYTALLLRALQRRPARVVPALALPFAAAAHLAGLRDNAWLKARFLGAILAGIGREDLRGVTGPFVADLLHRGLRTRALAAIDAHRASGDLLVLATASFDFYCLEIGRALGFDTVVCTESRWQDERLVPVLATGNCYGVVKQRRVQELLAGLPGPARLTVYSDSHADLPLLGMAEVAVAVNPTRRLAAIAAARNYRIEDWGS
jgi:HAD superfamily hydrolase (TIGR01490 family)